MSSNTHDLSWFALRLQELLNTSFPEKAWDTTFINQRATAAAAAYENAFLAGNPIVECERIANTVLYNGFYFSRFDAVFKVVCNEFDTRMTDEALHPFAMRMLPVCTAVFEEYQLTNDFEDSPLNDQLYTELTGTIANWIDEHGLQ